MKEKPKKTKNKNSEAIDFLKKKYFEILAEEDIGNTPELTEKADNIEKAIRELENE